MGGPILISKNSQDRCHHRTLPSCHRTLSSCHRTLPSCHRTLPSRHRTLPNTSFCVQKQAPLPGNPFLDPPFVGNTSFCVRKQAPLPGESILQAFSGLSVLPQGLFLAKKCVPGFCNQKSCKIVSPGRGACFRTQKLLIT